MWPLPNTLALIASVRKTERKRLVVVLLLRQRMMLCNVTDFRLFVLRAVLSGTRHVQLRYTSFRLLFLCGSLVTPSTKPANYQPNKQKKSKIWKFVFNPLHLRIGVLFGWKMSWRAAIGHRVREIRLNFCASSKSSEGLRNYVSYCMHWTL